MTAGFSVVKRCAASSPFAGLGSSHRTARGAPDGLDADPNPSASLVCRGNEGERMFIGHYGPAAAVAGSRVKLWHGFVAVQFLDILWAPAILTGVEKVRIVERFTASNHFDLYHMPYTHSLLMAGVWSVIAGGLYALVRRQAGVIGGIIIGALVFSHWLLDFVTHKPDLALWFGGPKVGLGLWENRPLAVSAEFAFVVAGFAIYLARTSARGAGGTLSLALLFVLMAVAQLIGNFGPPPGSPNEAAYSAIGSYVVFAALAAWVDATRDVKSAPKA
ncbi:MAG: hypothetical protein AAFW81_06575 [Pseudomonadota bacterium]